MDFGFDNLMRGIILDLLAWLPITGKKLSRCIVMTHELLEEFFMNESLEFSSLYTLESILKAKSSEEADNFINEKNINLLYTVYYQFYDKIVLPSVAEMQNATQNNPVE